MQFFYVMTDKIIGFKITFSTYVRGHDSDNTFIQINCPHSRGLIIITADCACAVNLISDLSKLCTQSSIKERIRLTNNSLRAFARAESVYK